MTRQSKTALAFITPHLMGFALLFIIPFIISIYLSFQKSVLRLGVFGFDNYQRVLTSPAFQLAVVNNVVFMVAGLCLIMVLSYLLSYSLYSTQAPNWQVLAFVLPIAIPSAAVIGFFRNLFNQITYMSILDTDYAMLAVIILFLWKNMGYNVLIFMASFAGIPKALYENAMIDGANRWQILWHIILPQMLTTIGFALVVSVLNAYKVFKEIYLLAGNYPSPNIYMLQNYMNNKAASLEIGELTAASILYFLALLAVVGPIYIIYRKRVKQEAIDDR